MGLDYSYRLYFRRDQLEDVLQGVADLAEKHFPPTRIIFPDHVLELPLESGLVEGETYQYNDAELGFDTVLIFEEDEAILDWGHANSVEDRDLIPSGEGCSNPVSVGYIYLTVYNDLSKYFPEIDLVLNDLVLFDFGTTGTRMSLLFRYSTSIRQTFTGLLRKFDGVCGLLNREEEGEVFWLNGASIEGYIDDVWLSPEEIKIRLGGQ